jgi:O-antigen/teichoic acid export membrane protein
VVGTVLRLGNTLLLTRLLAPEAYAVIGTALVVLTTLEWLSDLGIIPALVRHPEGARADWLLVGWWVALSRGAGLSAVAAVCAIPLAHFYHLPDLAGVMFALALRPVLNALRSPAAPVLRRNLENRALFVDEVGQVIVGAAVSIGVAAAYPASGAWALAAGTLAGTMSGVVTSYVLAPMTPRWLWDAVIARQLAGFGGAVFLNTLVMAAWLNLDRLAGARLLPPEPIGLYVVAWGLAAAAEAVTTRGLEVYFSLLARRSPQERTEWHDLTADRISRLAGPALAVGVVIAPLVARVLYDVRYLGTGMLLALLLARLLVRVAGQTDFQLLLATGRLRPAILAYAAAAVAQMVLIFPLTAAYGVLGMAFSVLASTVVVTAVQACLAPELGRKALVRLASAVVWATIGLGGAVAVDRIVTG